MNSMVKGKSVGRLKERLKAGESLLGCWSILASPSVSEIVGRSGFDFQILDFEHGVFNLGTLESCIRASEAGDTTVIVRPPGLDMAAVQGALDLGAEGLIFPQVASAAEVENALALTRFAPHGVRGYNPFTRAFGYGLNPGIQASDSVVRSVIIENLGAWNEIDRILDNEALDLLYLGVYDMSIAMGCPGDVTNPKILDFVDQAIVKITKAGRAVGLMVRSEQEIARYRSMGVQLMVYGVDSQLLSFAVKKCRDDFDRALSHKL